MLFYSLVVVCVLVSFQTAFSFSRSQISMNTSPFASFLDVLKPGAKSSSSKGPRISTVAITGASGLVGRALTKSLRQQQIKVVQITTKRSKNGDNTVIWDPLTSSIDGVEKLEGLDAVVHLAGENVASGEGILSFLGLWTPSKKQKILNSRVEGTRLLIETLSQLKKKPKTLISASGIGYYGFKDFDTVFDEKKVVQGEGFLAEVCRAWESEALVAQQKLNIRTVCLRFAPIFSMEAGILKKLAPIFQLGAGGIVADGKQAFSWVSLNDVVRAIEFVLTENMSISGPVNVCSPNPVTNGDFTSAFASALNRPAFIPVPAFAVNSGFGEMGQEMLLGGQQAVPSKLTKAGFEFEDSDIRQALKKIVQQR